MNRETSNEKLTKILIKKKTKVNHLQTTNLPYNIVPSI